MLPGEESAKVLSSRLGHWQLIEQRNEIRSGTDQRPGDAIDLLRCQRDIVWQSYSRTSFRFCVDID